MVIPEGPTWTKTRYGTYGPVRRSHNEEAFVRAVRAIADQHHALHAIADGSVKMQKISRSRRKFLWKQRRKVTQKIERGWRSPYHQSALLEALVGELTFKINSGFEITPGLPVKLTYGTN